MHTMLDVGLDGDVQRDARSCRWRSPAFASTSASRLGVREGADDTRRRAGLLPERELGSRAERRRRPGDAREAVRPAAARSCSRRATEVFSASRLTTDLSETLASGDRRFGGGHSFFVTSHYPPPHYSASRWGPPSSARPRARSPPSPARPRFRETRPRPRHPRGRRRGTPRSRARDAAASRCGAGAGDGTQWAQAARRTPGEARTPGWSFASCARCGCAEVVTPARCNGRLPGSIRRGSRAAKGRAGDPEGDFDRGVHFPPLRRTARPRAASPLGRPRASCGASPPTGARL